VTQVPKKKAPRYGAFVAFGQSSRNYGGGAVTIGEQPGDVSKPAARHIVLARWAKTPL